MRKCSILRSFSSISSPVCRQTPIASRSQQLARTYLRIDCIVELLGHSESYLKGCSQESLFSFQLNFSKLSSRDRELRLWASRSPAAGGAKPRALRPSP